VGEKLDGERREVDGKKEKGAAQVTGDVKYHVYLVLFAHSP